MAEDKKQANKPKDRQKVLVLTPPSMYTSNVVRDLIYGCWCKGKRIGGAQAPPLNLLYIATVLKDQGHDVIFIDALAEKKDLAYVKTKAKDRDVVVISTSSMSYNEDASFLSKIKKINPNIKSIVFGSHPTFEPEYCLSKDSVDIVVRREPEFIIKNVVNGLGEKNDIWKQVKGIGFKEGNKTIINPEAPLIADLDKLPIPDRSFLAKDVDYFSPIVARLPYTTMMTSRGCPGLCTFCNVPDFYGHKSRFMSSQKVIDEIDHIIKNGYKEIWFRDETFTAYRRRNHEIMHEMIKRKYDVTWIANARANMIDKETMALMKKAGCHMIKFGVESGVQHILDKVKKGTTLEQARKCFRWTHELGIETHAHVMLGMPGETEETMKATIRFVKEIDPTTVTFGICTPYAGTPLFKDVIGKKVGLKDGSEQDLGKIHTKAFYNKYYTKVDEKTIEKYVKKAYRSFYLRPSYLIRTLFRIRTLDQLKIKMVAGSNVFSFMSGDE
jgi:radical SAM superfamily enzyme YgiQ (UPF0313 family)